MQWNYKVPSNRHGEPQPACVLLESELDGLEHYFLHWSLSDDSSPTVVCKVRTQDTVLDMQSQSESF